MSVNGPDVIEADLTLVDGRLESGVRIEVDPEGRIAGVGAIDRPVTRRLERRAVLPGMVNAHSHAFQRGLRGRGETFGGGAAGSFWTWREAMYELVEGMSPERMGELCRAAFGEMRAAGITTVGEFHYLHHHHDHEAGGAGFALDEVVLAAAAETGVRLVLLVAFYRTGGIDRPLSRPQRRFRVDSCDAYWAQIDRLKERIDPATQSLGVVAHSIRAADIDDIAALHAEAERRGLVFHMHVEEQPREIEECLARYGRTPMALLNERLEITPRFTAVHCTHTAAADMVEFLDAGGTVCLCPLTEANLGDGLADVPFIRGRGGRICLGTDSNARISMLEEMRWLEYGQRLRTRSRGVVIDGAGRVGAALWPAATIDGAHALGVRTGAIRRGYQADLIAIDLDHPSLAGGTDETLMDTLILGAADDVIVGTCVGGRWKGRG